MLIQELPKFRWLESIKTDLARRDRKRWCSYHKEHGHTIEQCKNLHYLVEELIKVKHFNQYVHTPGGRDEAEATEQAFLSPTTPLVVINYIHEGLIDEKYHSKR